MLLTPPILADLLRAEPAPALLALVRRQAAASPWVLPLAGGVAVVLCAAAVWLYPAQVKRVRRPWRWVLPGLRVAGLLALVASLARPIALRARPANERGPVLVLIDRSRSMGVVDTGRRHADLVALADG